MSFLSNDETQKLDTFKNVPKQIDFLNFCGIAKIGKGKAEPLSVFILKANLNS
jgi:hypothetical protein